jgi:hypothetical protein
MYEDTTYRARDSVFIYQYNIDTSRKFNLVPAIQKYNPVIHAIEIYRQDQGKYPPNLQTLVPTYLSEVPDIYIRYGEELTYKPVAEHDSDVPFTFFIYGHYPGIQFMHGWFFKYCPYKMDSCKDKSRITDDWIWVVSSW